MKAIVNPKQVYSYTQMQQDIELLQQGYPSLINVETIGKSVDGRSIYALKLGNGNREIFMNGAHHAREWLTTSVLMQMIDVYCQAYVQNSTIGDYDPQQIFTNSCIWFVPMVNPDGVMLVQQGYQTAKNPERVIQINGGNKDFSAWKANISGVDLNRQYPAGWEDIQDNPGKPQPSMYKGPHPLSEPETQAIHRFTLKHDFEMAISYHSSGEELFWQYKSTGSLKRKTRSIAQKISDKTGYQLVDPGPNPSGGGYTDWFLEVMQKPAITPEISPLVGPRPVPLENYDKIWNDHKEIGLMLAQEILKKFE
ncbi:M14 family metallopeptidase [Aquibacillus sediminis]|uniref:M14 family metallopeptidase n=1 Tax=Aquibacillus sediminis TaxID=2574734 RepID=UPI0014875742|nr:M14 family metallocarboxypeptidase [Aquibacillus sediminis]